jgi:hypothetical protein
MKTAEPILIGTASTKPMEAFTSVPMIVGSVLNSRVTGFHVVPIRNFKPNFWIASQAP